MPTHPLPIAKINRFLAESSAAKEAKDAVSLLLELAATPLDIVTEANGGLRMVYPHSLEIFVSPAGEIDLVEPAARAFKRTSLQNLIQQIEGKF